MPKEANKTERLLEKFSKEIREDIKDYTDEKIEESKRHTEVLFEKQEDNIGMISEQHKSIMKTLHSHTEMIASMKEDIEIIKSQLRIKVDVDDYESLERRVSALEKKVLAS